MAESIIKSPQFKTGTLARTSGSFGVWGPTNREVLFHMFTESGLYLINLGFVVNIGNENVGGEVSNVYLYDRLDEGGTHTDTLLRSIQFEGNDTRAPISFTHVGRFEALHQAIVKVTLDSGRYSNLRLLPKLETEQNVWWLKLSD